MFSHSVIRSQTKHSIELIEVFTKRERLEVSVITESLKNSLAEREEVERNLIAKFKQRNIQSNSKAKKSTQDKGTQCNLIS